MEGQANGAGVSETVLQLAVCRLKWGRLSGHPCLRSLFPDFVSASPLRPSPSSPPFAPFASPFPPPSACTLPSSESCVVSLTICCPRLVARLVTRHRLVCPFARPLLVLSLPLSPSSNDKLVRHEHDGRTDETISFSRLRHFRVSKQQSEGPVCAFAIH